MTRVSQLVGTMAGNSVVEKAGSLAASTGYTRVATTVVMTVVESVLQSDSQSAVASVKCLAELKAY